MASFTYTPSFAAFPNGADLSRQGRFAATAEFLSSLLLDNTVSAGVRPVDFDESGNQVILPTQVFDNTKPWSMFGTMRIDTHGAGNVHETWFWVGTPSGTSIKVGFEIDDTVTARNFSLTLTV